MPRSKSSVTHRARTKKVFKQAKGYYGHRKNVLRVAKQSIMRSGMFAFAHRRKKKGDYRTLWQIRINAALKELGLMSYSRLIFNLKQVGITLDRKVLAYLAINDLEGFKQVALEAEKAPEKATSSTADKQAESPSSALKTQEKTKTQKKISDQ